MNEKATEQNQSSGFEVKDNAIAGAQNEASEYPLGTGFVLENEQGALQRTACDEAKGRHVFRDTLVGEQIEVVEIRRKNKIAESMKTDESLTSWLLLIDGTIGLPQGRKPQGLIKEFNGMHYGSCTYNANGQEKTASIVVGNGRALLVYGDIAPIISHLKLVESADVGDSAIPAASSAGVGEKQSKASPLSRLKKLFGK